MPTGNFIKKPGQMEDQFQGDTDSVPTNLEKNNDNIVIRSLDFGKKL